MLVTTKSTPVEILAWKNSQQIRSAFNKLNEKISDSDKITWYARILEKVWPRAKKLSKEKIRFTILVCQYLLSPKIESIRIENGVIQKIIRRTIVSIKYEGFIIVQNT